MKHPVRICIIPVVIACACVSCGDDPQMVAKHEKQKVEIARLTGELALIEAKLKNMPPDVSEELDKAKKQADAQTAEVAKLEAEISELEGRKRSLQNEFDSYRAKYQLK